MASEQGKQVRYGIPDKEEARWFGAGFLELVFFRRGATLTSVISCPCFISSTRWNPAYRPSHTTSPLYLL